MSSATPWWAVPATALLTLVWTTYAELSRRRLERAKQWDPQKMEVYIGFWNACEALLDVPVWSADQSTPPVPAKPLTDPIGRFYREIVFRSPAAVTRAAHPAAERAIAFADAVEDIRRSTTRGVHGALDDEARQRYDPARMAFRTAIDDFARAARGDVKVSDPYEPPGNHTRNPYGSA